MTNSTLLPHSSVVVSYFPKQHHQPPLGNVEWWDGHKPVSTQRARIPLPRVNIQNIVGIYYEPPPVIFLLTTMPSKAQSVVREEHGRHSITAPAVCCAANTSTSRIFCCFQNPFVQTQVIYNSSTVKFL